MHRFSLQNLHRLCTRTLAKPGPGRYACTLRRALASVIPNRARTLAVLESEFPDTSRIDRAAFLVAVQALVDELNKNLDNCAVTVSFQSHVGLEPFLADTFELRVSTTRGLPETASQRQYLGEQLYRLAPVLQFQKPIAA